MAANQDQSVESQGDAVLNIAGIVKSFPGPLGPCRVLSGIDLIVERGELVAVGGPSGSGKTTLLTIVAGWERPDAGSVSLIGSDERLSRRMSQGPTEHTWNEIAVVPQSLGLLNEVTVAENITLPLRLDRHAGSGDAATLFRRLGIDHLADRFPSEVSLGEQQRAALARAMIVKPAVLLADEPIAHQDQGWAEAMMILLRALADEGTVCILATHNEAAFKVADRVLELQRGQLCPLFG